jgi:ABC-type sugar transport system substrate-binding protein
VSKKTSLAARAVAVAATALLTLGVAACGGSSGSTAAGGGGGSEALTLGFAQVGAESGWRYRQHEVDPGFGGRAGVNLKFSDGQQKQENQIKAIRSYIQQKVDVIAFSPVVTTGWDTVLQEAKRANIPVILTDRAVDTPDQTLYKTFLGRTSSPRARRRATGSSRRRRRRPVRARSCSSRAPPAPPRPSTAPRASPPHRRQPRT